MTVRRTKAKAIERLRKVLNEVPQLKKLPDDSPEFARWHRNAQVAINNTFGSESSHVTDFNKIHYLRIALVLGTTNPKSQATYVRGLESAASLLESMIDEIEEYWEEDEQSSNTLDSQVKMTKSTNKVFVVHGHDEAARETVARFLERLRLEPVVLHEQPNKGRTIIEKFVEHADVGFVVVLLTPDDLGALAKNKDELKPRARQNVILEMVFFIGQLGRERVCPFVKGAVETPSDYDGVVYTKLDDSGGWKTKLNEELKAAGFDVDANRALHA